MGGGGMFEDRSLLIRVEVWRVEERLEIRDYWVKATGFNFIGTEQSNAILGNKENYSAGSE